MVTDGVLKKTAETFFFYAISEANYGSVIWEIFKTMRITHFHAI